MRLDDDMQRVIREQSLGFVATVCPDGTRTCRQGHDDRLGRRAPRVPRTSIRPTTVANLGSNPSVEINVVDPIVRKGYRFKGRAEVLTEGALHDQVLDRFHRERGHRRHKGAVGRDGPGRRRRTARVARLRLRADRGGHRQAVARSLEARRRPSRP